MREILFRGRRIDGSELVYGDLVHIGNNTRIYVEKGAARYTVDPATVGQYTGLDDKNGAKIFEGDIVKLKDTENHGEIRFSLGQFVVGFNMPIAYERWSCEVIGNIHDQPSEKDN